MQVGVPKETKTHEYRVGLVPASVRELVHCGHEIKVQKNAGLEVGFSDTVYQEVGATIVDTAEEIFHWGELIIKVKEPETPELHLLLENQILFTYLHLAATPKQTKELINSGCIAIAYETVTDNSGGLPLLAPMSEVAGRMSVQVGAHCLEREQGGAGILLGGVPGVSAAKVVILGGGVVGTNAARMAMGLGASVTVIDKSLSRLNELDMQFGATLNTIFATMEAIDHHVMGADLVIGAVLVPGASAPKLVSHEIVKNMGLGSVLVDVAIDQGGCFETSQPTSHDNPTFIKNGVVHYCVTNMPGAVARTSTQALNNATLPFIMEIANKGYVRAMEENQHLMRGLNIHKGLVTYEAVANDLSYDYTPPEKVLTRFPKYS